MKPYLYTAVKAATEAGKLIVRSFDSIDNLSIVEKEHNDFVTEVDKNAEMKIIDILRTAYPNHSFLAEESSPDLTFWDKDYCWIIDPLDGTSNFIHNIPHFAVSIALMVKGQLSVAIVFDPIKQETFTAIRGEGAQLNNRRIRVSQEDQLDFALIGTGFPFRNPEYQDRYLMSFQHIMDQCSDIRRCGAASLDLAYVASGRFDGFWECALMPWDIAAGALIIQEAGGFISDFKQNDSFLRNGQVIAGNGSIHGKLTQIIDKTINQPI